MNSIISILKWMGTWDWGNVADWFGSVGTIAAVVLVLFQNKVEKQTKIDKRKIEDLTKIYGLITTIRDLPRLVNESNNHFLYYGSDGANFSSGNDNAHLKVMQKIHKENIIKILNFQKIIDEIDLNIELMSDTGNNLDIKEITAKLHYHFYLLNMNLCTIQSFENNKEEPDENVGADYLSRLIAIKESYEKLSVMVTNEVKRIKEVGA